MSPKIMARDDDDSVSPPGFRFHPTDEELVGFYLRRKVENRPIRIELIRQADIYKYDPWDLPKSSSVGENEWYFFCKRGRKYKNSIRPNRVTSSGFWKATGIDKPVYSSMGGGDHCIGLKKSLVYYRGSAGKGTKTEWMMHEFRLPSGHDKAITRHTNPKNIDQAEAEVWTLCRIVKKKACNRKLVSDWRGSSMAAKKGGIMSIVNNRACSDTGSVESCGQNNGVRNYISFSAPHAAGENKKPYPGHVGLGIPDQRQVMHPAGYIRSSSSIMYEATSAASSFSSYICGDDRNNEDWEDLRSVVNCAAANPFYK